MSDLRGWRQQMQHEHDEGSTEFREDQEPICRTCQERFALEHEDYCSGCLIHAEDAGDPACDACGSTLDWTGGCGCDLPPADDVYWARHR